MDQEVVALAGSVGSAVVAAAGTDAWATLRAAVAGWFGGGDVHRERMELEQLDRTAAAIEEAGPVGSDRVGIRQEAVWQTRIENLLERLPADGQARAVEELRDVLARHEHAAHGGASAGPGGVTVGGNVERIRAEGGSAAAVGMRDVTISSPVPSSQPGPNEG